jgi:ubiquinone/menaquinone biosynthesis C-methylase UbiE
MTIKLKSDIQVTQKKELHYIVESGNRLMRFKPWLGDCFSPLYDAIMRKSVFPKKFGADLNKHYATLAQMLADIRGSQVLELAAGSGSAIHFLNNDNAYTGTDISPSLLRQAAKHFKEAGFPTSEFYVVCAEDLPFEQDMVDLCLCILALNFFGNVDQVFQEVRRVLAPGGIFVCSVPVPERNRLQSRIRGTLYSEAELRGICQAHNFNFQSIPAENGALLYFKAALKD